MATRNMSTTILRALILICVKNWLLAASLKIDSFDGQLSKSDWNSLSHPIDTFNKKPANIEWDDDDVGARQSQARVNDFIGPGRGWTKVSVPNQVDDPSVRYSDRSDSGIVSAIHQVESPSSQWKPLEPASLDEVRSARIHRERVEDSPRDGLKGADWKPLIGSTGPSTKPYKQGSSSGSLQPSNAAIEEPFDVEYDKLTDHSSDAKSVGIGEKKSDGADGSSRWTPVVEVSSNASQSDPAQKSASDLSYVYSSQATMMQPTDVGGWTSAASQQMIDARSSSPGYAYSYQQQPAPQSQATVDQQGGSIVDSTSGALPEMIGDKGLNPSGIDWASQPTRATQEISGYYDNYSYDYSQPRAQLPARQTVSPMRQENHYHHYYLQQQPPQQADRQARREIQPLVISQPIIQQVPSQAPQTQIIREVIKEVPVQSPPVPVPMPIRFLVAVPAPKVNREIDYSHSAGRDAGYATSSQRAIPGPVASQIAQPVRMQLPPLRLQQAPVTRQTASYVIPPMPKKTTTYLTETQAVPTHTTIMHTTQFTPATKTTIFTTDHQPIATPPAAEPAPDTTRLTGTSINYK